MTDEAEVEDLHSRNAFIMISNALGLPGRLDLQRRLGLSYDGKRDIYTALGYKKDLLFDDYWNKYRRGDIASRLIDAPVQATWRGKPEILVDGEPWKEWDELAEDLQIWGYFTRVDTLSSVGQFAVLFLGYKDDVSTKLTEGNTGNVATIDLALPVTNAKEIAFVRPYAQSNAKITKFNSDVTSEDFGQPKTYSLETQELENSDTADASSVTQLTLNVDASRILHVAQGLLESETYGTPSLQAVFNRLDDLDKVVGGSSEMYWRGAFPGMAFESEGDAEIDEKEIDRMNDEIENYVHSMSRYIRLSNTKAKTLSPNISSPKDNIEALLTIISATQAIPQRILKGSERGELASTQDESNWFATINERRIDFAEPQIIRPFIDAMIEEKILKAPTKGYQVVWPDLAKLSEESAVKINEKKVKMIGEWVSKGGEAVIPVDRFLVDMLGYTEDEAKAIGNTTADLIREEDKLLKEIEKDEVS